MAANEPTMEQRIAAWDCHASLERLPERLERLRPYWESSRYALTEDDVRHDYINGRHRYARGASTPPRMIAAED